MTVLESDPVNVGGISRTVSYRGFHFDIGGHRFFSKSRDVEDLWTELLPNDLLVRPRSSRILYRGKFFSYPLRAFEALWKLGIWESARCMLSYLRARLRPVKNPRNFAEWTTNQFGARLFSIFFKTYTEKVWGMSCNEISADWAAQRIKGLSLITAVLAALWPKRARRKRGAVVKTLIESFRYPRLGPGMMWESCMRKTRVFGGRVELGRMVTRLAYDGREWAVTSRDSAGVEHTVHAEHVISSAPIRPLARMISPGLSEETARAASALKYRDFITVVLILRDRGQLRDNWIYVHDPAVQVGRIQNFKSWSPEMVPDPAMACYGLEYFCFEHTGLWNLKDEELQELGARELVQLGLAERADITDGCVVRQPKAYPVYDDDYAAHVATFRAELEERFPTLHLVGRNGMHKYNNQDHSMMTAMLCARNILAGERRYDLWQVNEDAEYHESGSSGGSGAGGLREVPRRVAPAADEAHA